MNCFSHITPVLALVAANVMAQGTVTIYGTVSDKSGAVVPNVEITISNTLTGASRSVKSNDTGNYVAPQLAVGVYSVRAQMQGFKSFVQDKIQVQVDENRQVNILLEVGSLAESVEVQAEVTQVETRSGSIREVVDSARIVGLPLNGRNPLQLTRLVAGSGGVAGKDQGQNETVSINGARTNSNNYQLDGGDNHDPYFNAPAIFPNPDALDEFSIQTNSYGADRGRNAGAFMTAVTKSGTNQFHGSLFEFLRNEKMNARNFFSTTVPPFRRNQYGGTIGGRLLRDRTFFFGSFQGTSERSAPGAVTATVPTEAQRRGDFSSSRITLRDPNGGTFPGNIIPSSRLNAASQKFLQAFVPLPNLANGILTTASQQKVDDYQGVVKLDHRFTNANSISGRLLRNKNDFQEATGNLPGFFALINYQNWNAAVTKSGTNQFHGS
ncbi:MAG: carboxypeptidase regulatory-like domain-containing protein, partial [Bryobacteraceae bacterium]|nr:carboxypeptidase regulatory-like domain-containing protein [Bryobacteraceae bacterium]